MSRSFLRLAAALSLSSLLACGSGGGGDEADSSPRPAAPQPSSSPRPSGSPSPTPSQTPGPSPTPDPTVTPEPTPPLPPGAFPINFPEMASEGLTTQAFATTRYVAFHTQQRLDAKDTNGTSDIYLRDQRLGTTVLVSRAPSGAAGNGRSRSASISENGRWVVFASDATNLSGDDRNGVRDIFLYDVHSRRVSRLSDLTGSEANGNCDTPSVSADGSRIVFSSTATSFSGLATSGTRQIYLIERSTGKISLVSQSGGQAATGDCQHPSISADGNRVLFSSKATNLYSGANGFSQIFAYDVGSGSLSLASANSAGQPADGDCLGPDLAATGQPIVFFSRASNLQGDSADHWQVFRRDDDRLGMVSQTSGGRAGDGDSGLCDISSDGRSVSFTTLAANLGEASSGSPRIMISDGKELQDSGRAEYAALSQDGSRVALRSTAALVGEGGGDGGSPNVFVHRRTTGPTLRLTKPWALHSREFESARGLVSKLDYFTVGDFDGDGNQDYAGLNSRQDLLQAHFGDGGGRFSAPVTLPTGPNPQGLVAANLNGSGGQELLVTSYDDRTLSVVDFAGARTAATTSTVSVTQGATEVVVADFDQDGNLDAAVACFSGISVRWGDGQGGLLPGPDGLGPYTGHVGTGDFNGDGRPDLVGQGTGHGIALAFSGPGRTFDTSSPSLAAGGQVDRIFPVDFDGDGDLDIVTNPGIFYNDGSGAFTKGGERFDGTYTVADITRDGRPDIILATTGTPRGISVLENRAGGVLTSVQTVSLDRPQNPQVADFDGDGLPDIVAKAGNNLSAIIVSGPGGRFRDSQKIFPSRYPNNGSVFGDFDGDDRLDLMVNSGYLTLYSNLAANGWNTPRTLPEGWFTDVTDLDGNGVLDLLLSTAVAINDGTATLTLGTSFGPLSQNVEATAIHANGDDFPDLLLVARQAGWVRWRPGDATMSYAAELPIDVVDPTTGRGIYLDNDGFQDAVIGDYYGGIHVFRSTDGGFAKVQTLSVGQQVNGIAIGDFNSDGFDDLAASLGTSGAVGSLAIFLNNGEGQLVQSSLLALQSITQTVTATDLDNDGHTDLVVPGFLDGATSVFYGLGNGEFVRDLSLMTGERATPGHASVGDVNGDGVDDIVTSSANENSLGYHRRR